MQGKSLHNCIDNCIGKHLGSVKQLRDESVCQYVEADVSGKGVLMGKGTDSFLHIAFSEHTIDTLGGGETCVHEVLGYGLCSCYVVCLFEGVDSVTVPDLCGER